MSRILFGVAVCAAVGGLFGLTLVAIALIFGGDSVASWMKG